MVIGNNVGSIVAGVIASKKKKKGMDLSMYKFRIYDTWAVWYCVWYPTDQRVTQDLVEE